MSLEKDITMIRGIMEANEANDAGPIFKPATPQNLAKRDELNPEIQREKQERARAEAERTLRDEALKRATYNADFKIKAVLKLMGFKAEQPAGWNRWLGKNKAGESISLRFTVDYGKDPSTGRIRVYGDYPRDRKHNHVGDVYVDNNKLTQPEITLSASKTAEQMVADINRRFMPYYKQYFAAALKKATEADSYEDSTSSVLTAIKGAKLTQWEAEHYEVSISAGSDDDSIYGNVKASGDSIRLDVSGLTVEQMKSIMTIIKGKVR